MMTEKSKTEGGVGARAPTIADIARACGVGTSTVSRALNAQARVKPATREKVLAAARELGYRPNPAVASLVSLRERKHGRARSGEDVVQLAVLHRLGGRENPSWMAQMNELGRARGLRFEDFDTLDPAHGDAAALGRTLYNRGFSGVLMHRIIHDPGWFGNFPWQHFAVLSLDPAFREVPLTIIRTSQFRDVQICWRKLREQGVRRIGAILPDREDGRIENSRRLGAWSECQAQTEPDAQVPPYLFSAIDETTLQGLPDWFECHRPEALIALLSGPLDFLEARLGRALQNAVVMNGGGGRYAGLDRSGAMEAEATRLMDFKIRAFDYGLPPIRIEHVVASLWRETE